ncbi:MAG: hypothetical protein IPG92_12570 [Flavobacteriales bacterium]|nr:hypothetical protein [Flavobacteriales bacterium]
MSVDVIGGVAPPIWSDATTNEDLLAAAGNYSVTGVTDANGCQFISDTYEIARRSASKLHLSEHGVGERAARLHEHER